MTGVEHWLLPKIGISSPPWTIHTEKPDYAYLKPAAECPKIEYPKPDGKLTFDRLGRCSSPTSTTRRTSRRT